MFLVMSVASVLATEEREADAFEANVKRIFADDDLADIRVIFGYDDYKGFLVTKDMFRAHRLIRYLQIRGYEEVRVTQELADQLDVPLDATNLRVYEGMNASGQVLRVSLIWSSATTDSAKNSGSDYALQRRCSRQALAFMKRAASSAEVMVYVGHSRGGGGPDTFPPMTRGVDGDGYPLTDFAYYRRHQPGLDALRAELRRSTLLPHVIAWTSCRSETHFRRWFSNVLSDKEHATSLILATRLTSYMPNNQEILDQDEGLMAFVCLLHAIQYRQSRDVLMDNLKRCEMEVEHDPKKAAWKLVAMPMR